MPPHPIPSSATAPTSVNAQAADGPGKSGPTCQRSEACCPVVCLGLVPKAWLSTSAKNGTKSACRCPGQLIWRLLMLLPYSTRDLGSQPCLLGLKTSCKRHFHVRVVGGMAHPGKLKVADGRVLVVQERTCPVRVALHTSWGLVTMDPFLLQSCRATTMLIFSETPTLKRLVIDVYDSLGARARERAALTDVDTAAYRQCRRVTASVDALQQQPSQDELDRGVSVEGMTHEPLGTFQGSQQRWATVDKEGLAMVSTFHRLKYLLWNGVHLYSDHRNLA